MSKLKRVHSTINFNDMNNKDFFKWNNASNSKASANTETEDKFKIIEKEN